STKSDDDYLSDTSSNPSTVFSDRKSETTSDSELNIDKDSDDNTIFNYFNFDKGQLPPGHYLAEAEILNEQYSNKTQEKVDETVKHWDRYYKHISIDPIRYGILLSSNEGSQIITIIAEKKGLELTQRPKKNIFIEDIAEFAHILLTTTKTTFTYTITTSRPSALLSLRYYNLVLTLIHNLEDSRPRLFMYLTPEFTKKFLGKKAPSTTGPVIDYPKNLYHLQILDGLGQQQLLIKEELLDKFIFYQITQHTTGFRIALENTITVSFLRFRIRRVGQILGIEDIIKPYYLRYAGAKAFNKSKEVTNTLQNVILQHTDIHTFIRYYKVDINIDIQGIIQQIGSQTTLIRFAYSLSTSINPNRPYRLLTKESQSLNKLPIIRTKATSQDLAHSTTRTHKTSRPSTSGKKLHNKKQHQRNQRNRKNLEHYKSKQPVINLKRQLQGKLIDSKVIRAIKNMKFISPEFIIVIKTIITMPSMTIEAEYQYRINTINTITAFYGVEEGQKDKIEVSLRQAIDSIQIKHPKDQPTICFLYIGNPLLPPKVRLQNHTTPSLLTRHFIQRYINPP
ncbi:hypothetical protein N7478_002257, partial [Penicillium angulare]|uniref:uncharacterized protein n=1 Tax=Penicillium angulare TaxID=116970 RepID=UPI002540FF5D